MSPDAAVETRGGTTFVPPRWLNVWTVLVIGLAIYTIRMLGPEDLADFYHQERAAAYVMDALRNGNWICQYGAVGEVSSKPPMLTWLAALASLPFGQANWFTLALPGALATLGLAALIFVAGSRYFGRMAGFFGAFVFLVSPIGAKQMVLVRIDGLFSFTIAVTALLGFRAWQTGRGWTWFWLAAALSTLTKGPLGVLLAGVGFIAAFWERRTSFPASVRGSHVPGVILYFVICGGWFALAYAKFGQPLIDVMLDRELRGHIVKSSRGPGPFLQFYLPTAIFLSRYAPWSLLTCLALWRAFKHPSADAEMRRFERFVSCWFLAGLLIFSCAAHQRPDLIFPLIPPAALLAGRVVANWLEPRLHLTRWLIPAATAAALVVFSFNYMHVVKKRVRYQRTAAVKQLAAMVKSAGGTGFPLTHVRSPYALQFYLNTKEQLVDGRSVANLLRQNPTVFVATSDYESIRKTLGADESKTHVLYRWRGSKEEPVDLISNHPRLEWTDDMHWLARPCLFRLMHVDNVDSYGDDFTFESKAPGASVTVRCVVAAPIRVRNVNSGVEKVLKPEEDWVIEFSRKLKLSVSRAGGT